MIISIINIVLAFIISLLVTCFVANLIDNKTIQIIVCLIVLFVSFPLLSLLGNLIYKLCRKHILIEKPYICFKCTNVELERIKENSVELNSHCFCIPTKQKHLKTITIQEITDSINYDNIHKQIITARKDIKKIFSVPKDSSPADYHWILDIKVIMVDNILDEELMMLFSRINDQYYAVGKYFAVYENDSNQIYCPIFNGKSPNLVAFCMYKKCQRMLLKLFNIKKANA